MTISYVQGNTARNLSGTPASTLGVTLAAPVGSGNAVVVWVGATQTDGWDNTTTVTDDKGNTYSFVNFVNGSSLSNNFAMASFYAFNVTNAPQTVTVTFKVASVATGQVYMTVMVDEFSGIATTSPLDAHAMQDLNGPGTGANAATSGNATTTVNGDLIAGAIVDSSAGGTVTEGSGFTVGQYPVTNTYKTEYQIQSSASASTAATFTLGLGTDFCYIGMIALKAAAGGAARTPTLTLMGVG